jgi:Gluconate 2-dehydrogenase subunit 3
MNTLFAQVANQNNEQILNFCTKYLVRGAKFFTENIAPNAQNLTTISEAWRFPLILSAKDPNGVTGTINKVILIWQRRTDAPIQQIEVIGSFAPLYQAIPLTPVLSDGQETGFYACTLLVPVGKCYFYKFRVNGQEALDDINPQRKLFSHGKEWSCFFTDYFTATEVFETWEVNLLYRLANQIVPFKSEEAQNFINRYYLSLAKSDQLAMPIYKLDDSVGEVNFITNILAREERHHLQDYKICIAVIDQLLRKRNPFVDSWAVSENLINTLYDEMATGQVPDWDYNRYANPTYFLGLIRRHTLTGAFSHPKYGGNVGGAGWNYLQQKYVIKDEAAQIIGSYFNWQHAMEAPLGTNQDYKG